MVYNQLVRVLVGREWNNAQAEGLWRGTRVGGWFWCHEGFKGKSQ
jgi:hypothetical protein